MTNDEILSAELLYTDEEILDRYRELFAEAAETPGRPVEELREVAADVCRVQSKNP